LANLYELSASYAFLIDAYDNAETQEDRDAYLAMLAEAEGDIEDKAENYAKVIRMKQAEAEAFKQEAERLTARRQAAENMVKRLKEALLDAMKLTGKNELPTSIGKWRLQMNPVSCEVTDAGKVPKEYHIPQEDKIDRKGLIDYYKQTGKLIDGVIFTQEPGIRFR